MNREIKFKAWNPYQKRIMGPYALDNIGELPSQCLDYVMQYTGLKDRNGVEIYDGYLIAPKEYPFYGIAPGLAGYDGECKELNYVGEVYFSEEDALFSVSLHVVSDRVAGRACGCSLFNYGDIEVIGNIHENPELLESQK